MVCNLVTYRARSAVREVGYALGFPRPLVDRVAKALASGQTVIKAVRMMEVPPPDEIVDSIY
jgi:DNA polymerase III alpha subunit